MATGVQVILMGDKKNGKENHRNYCEYDGDWCCDIFKLSSWDNL